MKGEITRMLVNKNGRIRRNELTNVPGGTGLFIYRGDGSKISVINIKSPDRYIKRVVRQQNEMNPVIRVEDQFTGEVLYRKGV